MRLNKKVDPPSSTAHAERIQPAREPSEFLSADELRDLTQRARRSDQAAELDAMGIPHMVQRGRLLVSRFHVRERLAGTVVRRPDLSKVR